MPLDSAPLSRGGEDGWFTDDVLCGSFVPSKTSFRIVITRSLGERSQKLSTASKCSRRHSLRHETADSVHYRAPHPQEMSFDHCMHARTLKHLGFQTGCGFTARFSPSNHRTHRRRFEIHRDLFPAMCAFGPFIPHADTPFRKEPAGSADLTCFLLSLVRLIHPKPPLPATTAPRSCRAEWSTNGGTLSGANVIMPNLSPVNVIGTNICFTTTNFPAAPESGAKPGLKELKARMKAIGYENVVRRGDSKQEGVKI